MSTLSAARAAGSDRGPAVSTLSTASTGLAIVVSDPEKHGTSQGKAFVDFKIRTTTDLPQYAASGEFFVRRRYRDFKCLRKQLCQSYPGCIVPPLPAEDWKLKDGRFSDAFIKRRQAGLQLFLRRVANHEELLQAEALQTFLEAKVWELQTAQNAARGDSSWFSTIVDGTETLQERIQSSLRPKVANEASTSAKLRAFAIDYDKFITRAAEQHHETVRTLGDTGDDLRQLGPAMHMLSQTQTELSQPFTHMAETLDRLKELHVRQVQEEHVSGLSALLAFNTGMASALKEVLANRDQAFLQYQRAEVAVASRKAEKERWEADMKQMGTEAKASPAPRRSILSSLSDFVGRAPDPEKGSKIDEKLAEEQQDLTLTKQRWEAIDNSIQTEVNRFHRSTAADFERGLREHINEQIRFQEAQQQQWRQLLDVFEQMEG